MFVSAEMSIDTWSCCGKAVSQSVPVIPNGAYASYEDDRKLLSDMLSAPDFVRYLCAIWKDEDIMMVAHG